MKRLLWLLPLLLICTPPRGSEAGRKGRFFVAGNGKLKIRSTKNRHRFAGRYRTRSGKYIARARRRIERVFGVPKRERGGRISLRLIEVLSFLQSRLKGGWVVISSGYRSPAYNRMLRAKGRTVAKASLHQYGMALDLKLEGRDSKRLWRYARKHRVGGAGYYGGPWIHVDTGPVRFWTQGTANVRKGLSDENKRVILVPEYDRYHPGERLRLRFARMTAYPIGVRRELSLERRRGSKQAHEWVVVTKGAALTPAAAKQDRACATFSQLEQMDDIRWSLPQDLAPGRYRLRATFCGKKWPAMPTSITSYEVVVRHPQRR